MKTMTNMLAAAFLVTTSAMAVDRDASKRDADTYEISAIFESLETAWANADGAAWGAQFTEDANFTTWFGYRLSGADMIAEGHQQIWDGFYAGSVFDLDVESLRFIDADVALVGLNGWVYSAGEVRPEAPPEAHPLAIIRHTDDGWKIEAFQNTPHFGAQCFGNSMKDAVARGGCVPPGPPPAP
ncbi:MAG: SgcJ/EcaC family oxidoreductase [Pseudomonadota bacterium]